MPEMNKAAILEWVLALESGDYQQGDMALIVPQPDGSTAYCCLGVACEVFADRVGLTRYEDCGYTWEDTEGVGHREGSVLPPPLARFLGFWNLQGNVTDSLDSSRTLTNLAALNDDEHYTFAEIAQVLRDNFLKEETDAA